MTMPRDDTPTPFRRLMMQSVMWLILGATVAAAGVVSHFKRQSLQPALGQAVDLQEISVQLPLGWIDRVGESDENNLIREHPQFGDVLLITVANQPRAIAIGESAGRSTLLKQIDLGGEQANLVIVRHPIRGGSDSIPELNVARDLPRGRRVTISLAAPGARRTTELQPGIDLIQRVAASVKIDPNH